MTNSDYLHPLGQITANFSDLEADLAGLIWSLIGDDKKIGQIVTAQLSFPKLLDTLSSLFRHKFEDKKDWIDELDGLIRGAQEISDKRNTLVHSVWFAGHPNTLRRVKIKAKRKEGLRIQSEDMEAEKLREFGNEIFSFILALDKFRAKVKL